MTETEEEYTRLPIADFTVVMHDGHQAKISDLGDNKLKKVALKHLRTIRREILKLCVIKAELEKREYAEGLAYLASFREYNVFQMMTHATALGINNYNRTYGQSTPIAIVKEEEE
ncbi:MAG: hypothetical protein CL581_09425 [Alteromonadaceae bacterium]|mgnify:CR=1 FL=1|jgi:hypothetical protein|nr:hypothetical protein [Alteromonadaceae bacterium]